MKNPRFQHKTAYLIFLLLRLLGYKTRSKIRNFANKHWDKNPGLMHRLYWTLD